MISKLTDTRSRQCLPTAQRLVLRAAERQVDLSAGLEDSRDEIDRELRSNLDRTKLAFECARDEFKAMMHEIPAGPPYPDGTAKMQIAEDSYLSAMEDYRRAAQEFSDFSSVTSFPYRLMEYGRTD